MKQLLSHSAPDGGPTLWKPFVINPDDQQVVGTVNGRFHMASTQTKGAARTVGKGFEDCAFQTISYSADGNLGDWTVKHQTEFGVIDMIRNRGADADEVLPGARRRVPKGDSVVHPEIIQTYATKFSPGGRMWVAATTEGVLLYTTDSAVTFFSPIDEITPQAIDEALRDELYDAALFMALKLNIPATTTMVLEKIPVSFHSAIVTSMTRPLLKLCLQHLASILNETSHVMFHMMLMRKMLQVHLSRLEDDRGFMRPIISNVQKAADRRIKESADMTDSNKHLMEVHQVMRENREKTERSGRVSNFKVKVDLCENGSEDDDGHEDTEHDVLSMDFFD
ncbi:Periodic tryptophan protein 2 [Orchesella cincta]|uniref:Periodic tryptophan protein 2 n=1 Tax=Orchesella cincta TaxID=48709 RepID=A0A1D2MHY5_ORCCI|nr:Periodic tryptophan protein 2 [Orchesella cincta]